jgi:hypothetical protein
VGSGTAKDAERRAHARVPIQLPVKVTLLATPLIDREVAKARAPTSREPVVTQAMALDVSERGLLLEIAGGSIQAVLDASDPLVGLEFVFMHDDLRYIGPRAGHVQWRRAGPDRNTWALGARLDVPLTADEISRIVRCSTNRPKSRPGVVVLFGATVLLGALGWYRSHATDVAERDATMRRLSTTEDELTQLRREMDLCRASLDTLRSAPALRSPPRASAGEKPKADPTGYDAGQAPTGTDRLDGGASADAVNGSARRDTTP